MKSSTVIKLPLPLHGQLKALAAARNSTMVDVIGDMVRKAIEAGELPDTIPGFDIEVGRETITLRTDEDVLAVMTHKRALNVATTLEEASGPKESLTLIFDHEDGADTYFYLEVGRVGTGVEIKGQTARRVVTPSIARDLARQIRTAANKVKP